MKYLCINITYHVYKKITQLLKLQASIGRWGLLRIVIYT